METMQLPSETPETRAHGGNPLIVYGAWLAETPDDWPDQAIETARMAFVDTLGVAIPGAAEPVARKVLATVSGWGGGDCTAIGSVTRLAAPWVALVNGTAAHALDFDDNFDPAKAHASAVLVPAILSLAEQESLSGRACLDAYVAGLQILGRVGQGVNPVHRNRGWHATATLGAVGAAAACARLLRLSAEQAAFALSIATSMAAGSMEQFGTMTKPLHAGLAAKSGVLAASLAHAGVDAGLDSLDGEHGMNRLMVGPDLEELRAGLTHIEHGQNLRFETESVGEPLLILSSGLKVKRFPNCGSAHRAMDGFLALRDRLGFAAQDLEAVRVFAPVTHLNNLMYRDPVTVAQARFSLEYALASLAVRGHCGLADFIPAAVMDPAVRALYPLIRREPVDKGEGEFPTRVELTLKDGTRDSAEVAMPVGSLESPLDRGQMQSKFDECARPWLSTDQLDGLRRAFAGFAELPRAGVAIEPLARPIVEVAGA